MNSVNYSGSTLTGEGPSMPRISIMGFSKHFSLAGFQASCLSADYVFSCLTVTTKGAFLSPYISLLCDRCASGSPICEILIVARPFRQVDFYMQHENVPVSVFICPSWFNGHRENKVFRS